MDDPELAREIICGAHTIIGLSTKESTVENKILNRTNRTWEHFLIV